MDRCDYLQSSGTPFNIKDTYTKGKRWALGSEKLHSICKAYKGLETKMYKELAGSLCTH